MTAPQPPSDDNIPAGAIRIDASHLLVDDLTVDAGTHPATGDRLIVAEAAGRYNGTDTRGAIKFVLTRTAAEALALELVTAAWSAATADHTAPTAMIVDPTDLIGLLAQFAAPYPADTPPPIVPFDELPPHAFTAAQHLGYGMASDAAAAIRTAAVDLEALFNASPDEPAQDGPR